MVRRGGIQTFVGHVKATAENTYRQTSDRKVLTEFRPAYYMHRRTLIELSTLSSWS